MEQLRFSQLANPAGGRMPIPDSFLDLHRARVKVWDFFGAADYTAADWNTNTVGTGTAAAVATNGATVGGPMLRLRATAATDGIGLRHNSMHLQMPALGIGHHFYVAFDVTASSLTANVHRAFGIATGTAAEAFNVDTGALFSVGGGILWQQVDTGNWSCIYKPPAKSPITLVSGLNMLLGSTAVHRLGFLVAANPANDAGYIGKIYPFAHSLNEPTFSGDGTDDQAGSLPSSFFPSPYGVTLNDTDHGCVANTDMAGIFVGHGTNTGSSRDTYVKRIIAVDNMRR